MLSIRCIINFAIRTLQPLKPTERPSVRGITAPLRKQVLFISCIDSTSTSVVGAGERDECDWSGDATLPNREQFNAHSSETSPNTGRDTVCRAIKWEAHHPCKSNK